MKHLQFACLLTVMIGVVSISSKAQYTYLAFGSSVENHFDGYGITRWDLGFSGIFRPSRNLGFGLSYAIPIYSFSTYRYPNYQTATSSDHWASHWHPLIANGLDYQHIHGPILSMRVRGFIETNINLYADIQLSISTITEKIIFIQEADPGRGPTGLYYERRLAQVNIDHEEVHRLLHPGFSLGVMPHILKHFYLDVNAGIQFITYKKDFAQTFDHYLYDNTTVAVVTLSSPLPRKIQTFTFHFGCGYFF